MQSSSRGKPLTVHVNGAFPDWRRSHARELIAGAIIQIPIYILRTIRQLYIECDDFLYSAPKPGSLTVTLTLNFSESITWRAADDSALLTLRQMASCSP